MKMPRILISSKAHAAQVAITLAIVAAETDRVPYWAALATVGAVAVSYIVATAIEDKDGGGPINIEDADR